MPKSSSADFWAGSRKRRWKGKGAMVDFINGRHSCDPFYQNRRTASNHKRPDQLLNRIIKPHSNLRKGAKSPRCTEIHDWDMDASLNRGGKATLFEGARGWMWGESGSRPGRD